MRRIAIGVLWAVGGYLLGAFGGGYAISLLSSNQHDSSVEAAMTGAFVLGPLGAIAGFAAGIIRSARLVPRLATGRRRRDAPSSGR